MIELSVALSLEGVIERLEARGHADFAAHGHDVVCAAFTVILRTFARSVESVPNMVWAVEIDRPGDFVMVVNEVPASFGAEYRGWCGFALRGFDDLHNDAPRGVIVRVTQSQRRVFHGS